MKSMQKIKQYLVAAGAIAGFGAMLMPSLPAYAAPPTGCVGANCITTGAQNVQTGGGSTNVEEIVKSITNILMFLIGAVAVIMIVIGGFKYTTSNGNAEQIKSAKNTIMYAVIGVVVALFAYAIVNFIISRLTS